MSDVTFSKIASIIIRRVFTGGETPTIAGCTCGEKPAPDPKAECEKNPAKVWNGSTCNDRAVAPPPDPKAECEKNPAKVWDAKHKECKDKTVPPRRNPKAECEKNPAKIWDARLKRCKDKEVPPPPDPKAECESRGRVWDGSTCKDKEVAPPPPEVKTLPSCTTFPSYLQPMKRQRGECK